MKKDYVAINSHQFHLTFAQHRPKSCIERISPTKKCKTTDRPAKDRHVRRCKSQQEVSHSSSSSGKQHPNHESFDAYKIADGLKTQQILISSALRRPHASCYSLLDSQSLPEHAKPRRPVYRPKSASTVYSYAERPVSACEISNHLGRQTKASLLRNKSSHEVMLTTHEPANCEKRKKKPCAVREEYMLHKNALTPKEVFDYMNSVHAYLTGARYNRSRLVDAKSLTKHGLYVSKDGLGSFILDKAKSLSSNNEHDIPNAALRFVETQTSPANVITVGTNTEPHYLSLNAWHDAEWNCPQGKKHLPPHKVEYRKTHSPNKVKPIKAKYIDYNTIVT